MDLGDLDTQQKIDALRGVLVGEDGDALFEAARRALIAAEFRAVDGMIGLPPADEELTEQMRELAHAALDKAAAVGHIDAGVDVANRIYFSRDSDRAGQALAYATRASDDPRALYLLGLFHYVGFGCPKDEVKSLDYHRQAAARGEADAMFELYVFLSKGIGTDRDDAQALDWCRRAADAGSARAMANLGGFYATGSGVAKDPAQALAWYEKAAEAGSGRAAATLGVMFALGDSVEADDDKARQYFALAGDLGYPWDDLAAQCGLDPDAYC